MLVTVVRCLVLLRGWAARTQGKDLRVIQHKQLNCAPGVTFAAHSQVTFQITSE